MPFWSAKGHLLECERRPSAFDTMNKFYIICVSFQFKHYLLTVGSVYNYHLTLGFSCHCFPSVGVALPICCTTVSLLLDINILIYGVTVSHQLDINLFICSVTVSYLLIHCFLSIGYQSLHLSRYSFLSIDSLFLICNILVSNQWDNSFSINWVVIG